jgi:hypothetical protein
MGNLNHKTPSKAFIALRDDIHNFIHSDKNTSDYLKTRKSQPEQIDEFNVIPSGIVDKIKSRDICEVSIEIVALLFNNAISRETGASLFNPLLVHKTTPSGESKALSSQLIYMEDLYVGRGLRAKYNKWNIDKDDSSLLEKLGQLSSIHAGSASLLSEASVREGEHKSTKKSRKSKVETKKSSSVHKDIKKKVKLRQVSEDHRIKIKTILHQMSKDKKEVRKVRMWI